MAAAPGRPRGPGVRLGGLSFPSPLGVAAGVDGAGRVGRRMGRLGFGFSEVGSVTLRPETGRAAVAEVCSHLSRAHGGLSPHDRATVLGAVVAVGRDTPPRFAADEMAACVTMLAPWVDYVTLTLCGRHGAPRWTAREAIRVMRGVADSHSRLAVAPPLWVKMPASADCSLLGAVAAASGYAAIVVEHGDMEVLDALSRVSPVVAVGGVRNSADAAVRLAAGATLVQTCRTVMRWGPLAGLRLRM